MVNRCVRCRKGVLDYLYGIWFQCRQCGAWRKLWVVLLLSVVNYTSAHAQVSKVADIASYATVAVPVAQDVWQSCRPVQSHACINQGLRLGLTWGVATIVKKVVHRNRPCAPECGIDSPSSSFYSLHTAFAASTIGGPKFALYWSVGTGAGRVVGLKHHVTDVLAGFGAGVAAGRIR